MEIMRSCAQPAFGMKFNNNKAFKEVVKYAEDNNQLGKLDAALNRLLHVKGGDILLLHGKTPKNLTFSNFTVKRTSISNISTSPLPEKVSFDAIIDLSRLGEKFRQLTGKKPENNITSSGIFERYTV